MSRGNGDGTAQAPPSGGSSRPLAVVVAASMLSKVADWQMGIVIPLAVLASSDSLATALVVFTMRGVAYVAAPVIGSVIDRFDKRTVFVGAQLQQAACLFLVAFVVDHNLLVAILLLLSGFGAVTASITAHFVLVPMLVEAQRRTVAVAKLAAAIELAKIVGLLLGGVVLSARGPAFAAMFIAVLYVGAAAVAATLPRVPAPPGNPRIWRDLGVGFRWVVRWEIRWLVLTMATANLAVGELETVLVTIFGSDGIQPVAISGVLAVGLFFGAVGSRLGPHLKPGWSLEKRVLLFQVLAFAALCLVSISLWLPVTVGGYILICAAHGASNVATIAYRQETIPVDLAGRVNSVIRMFIAGAIPLSGFLYAGATRLDGRWFWAPALVLAAVSVLTWWSYTARAGRLRTADNAERSDLEPEKPRRLRAADSNRGRADE